MRHLERLGFADKPLWLASTCPNCEDKLLFFPSLAGAALWPWACPFCTAGTDPKGSGQPQVSLWQCPARAIAQGLTLSSACWETHQSVLQSTVHKGLRGCLICCTVLGYSSPWWWLFVRSSLILQSVILHSGTLLLVEYNLFNLNFDWCSLLFSPGPGEANNSLISYFFLLACFPQINAVVYCLRPNSRMLRRIKPIFLLFLVLGNKGN